MLTHVKKTESYSQQAYNSLKKAIINNTLKPGEVLNEQKVASMIMISRTPLREAIHILQKEGWVVQSGKKRFVSPIEWRDIQEIYEIRLANEIFSSVMAIDRLVKVDFIRLRQIINEMEIEIEKGNLTNYIKLDKSFHLCILKACGNEKLYSFMEGIYEQFIRISFITLKNSNRRLSESLDEHTGIYNALKDKNKNEVKKYIESHVESWYKSLKKNWSDNING